MKNTTKIIATISRVPNFNSHEILVLMYDLEVDNRTFAMLMNVSEDTLKLWLNGVSEPNSTARRLMQIYSNTPCVIDCLAEGEDDDEDEYDL